MARLLLSSLLLLAAAAASAAAVDKSSYILGETLPKVRPERLTRLRVYWHDILTTRNRTTVPVVAAAPAYAKTSSFGQISMIDDALSVGPAMASGVVGRAQGFYAFADVHSPSLLMVMNFVFTEGKFNGSTFAVVGRNDVPLPVREMPIVGGSGRFRYARGYVQLRTRAIDYSTGNAVVQYDCYVRH